MRGGIVSKTVFKKLLKIRDENPWMFDPFEVSTKSEREIWQVLRRRIGWDAENAARFWFENSKRLVNHWGGNPLSILDGMTNYEEACRRFANKSGSARKRNKASHAGDLFRSSDEGFFGYGYKMVSMILYFLDWEGLLKPRFPYPSPADFHHYRIFIANRGLSIKTNNGRSVRYSEEISEKIRASVLDFIKKERADPVIVSDALWLFSLLMCGESLATVRSDNEIKTSPAPLLDGRVEAKVAIAQPSPMQLSRTCGICCFRESCELAIPAAPYYRKGIIEHAPRPTHSGVTEMPRGYEHSPRATRTESGQEQFLLPGLTSKIENDPDDA
jgi:hypothetical protein